jgi:hypothetical protein
LGPTGTLRIGGNSADQTVWTSAGEAPPTWAKATWTPATFERLAELLRATGWDAVLTAELKHHDAACAADEARYGSELLGRSLRAIETGNEPDLYGTSEDADWRTFHEYRQGIQAATPDVAFVAAGASRRLTAAGPRSSPTTLPVARRSRRSPGTCTRCRPAMAARSRWRSSSRRRSGRQKAAGSTRAAQAARVGAPRSWTRRIVSCTEASPA